MTEDQLPTSALIAACTQEVSTHVLAAADAAGLAMKEKLVP